jgi:hypothetical protein
MVSSANNIQVVQTLKVLTMDWAAAWNVEPQEASKIQRQPQHLLPTSDRVSMVGTKEMTTLLLDPPSP